MTTFRRIASTAIVLAMVMALTAVPALAAPLASATINDILYSGQDATVTITISNNGAPGDGGLGGVLGGTPADDSINALVIEVPTAVIDLNGSNPVTVSAWPNGSAFYDPEVEAVYAFAGEGEELAPGTSMTVVLSGTADLIADDTTRRVPVHVSADGGITAFSVSQTPELTSKILQITEVVPVKPAGVTNPNQFELTSGQDTADVRVTVQNFGSEARDVTVDADGTALTTDQAVVTVNAGSSATVDLDTVVGNVGTTTADAIAFSTNSEALPVSSNPITVQQAFDATYVPESLVPRDVRQGESIAFSLNANKVGVQPASLAASLTFETIAPADFQADITANFAAGNGQTSLSFPATTIPNVTNGDYEPTITLTGVDGNGATVDDLLDLDAVTITNLLPFVENLIARVPPSQVTGATPAATSGDTVNFTATITEGTLGGTTSICGECVVDDAYVETISGERIGDITFTNAAGNFSGSATLNYAAGTTSVRAVVEVTSPSGVSGDGATTYVVDVLAPTLGGSLTDLDGASCSPCVEVRRDASDVYTIEVPASELVNADGARPAHFTINGSTESVASIQANPASDGASSLTLTLSGPIDAQDNDLTLSYDPTTGGILSLDPGSPIIDRVGLEVAPVSLGIVDGIAPLAPVVTLVDGLGKQAAFGAEPEDAYWTNGSPQTTITVNARVGEILTLFFDKNGNGVNEDGEQLFEGEVTASTMEITADAAAIGNVNQNGRLIGQLFDGRLTGPISSDAFNVDVTAPVIDTFSASGNTVLVSFNEPVRDGARHAAFDWAAYAVQDGESRYRTVTTVTPIDRITVQLDVSAASYDPALGAITGVRFTYRGLEADLFVDRALNATPTGQAIGERP